MDIIFIMRRIYVSLLALIVIASGIPLQAEASSASVPGEHAPVEATLFVTDPAYVNSSGRPVQYGVIMGKEITICFQAEKFFAPLDSEMSMEIFLPAEVQQTGGATKFLGRDKKKDLLVTCIFPSAGDFKVKATVKKQISNFSANVEVLILSRNTSGDFEALKADAAPSTELNAKIMTRVSAGDTAPTFSDAPPAGYAHIQALILTYPFTDGRRYMLRGIRVDLLDSTNGLIKTVYSVEPTNEADYGLTPQNYYVGDTWTHVNNAGLCDFGHIYVNTSKALKFRIVYIFHDGGDGSTAGGTEKLAIRDSSNADEIVSAPTGLFTFSSGVYYGYYLYPPDLGAGNGSVLDEAAHIYYDITKAYSYLKSCAGYVPPLATTAYINYPDTQGPHCHGYRIDFAGWSSDYLVYQLTDSIVHEYAHSVMYGMRDGSFPPYAAGDSNHGNHSNVTSADGIIEGWARFLPTIINKDPLYHWATGWSTWDIRPNETCSVCHTCDRDEWVFGGVLWDIRTDISGDLHIWFLRIAETMQTRDPNLVKSFYCGIIAGGGDYTGVAQAFRNHGISYTGTQNTDHNGDGKSDYSVWRPGTGNWYVHPTFTPTQWGLPPDVAVHGDYNGNGTTDFAVWRPGNGLWYLYHIFTTPPQQFGLNGDVPVPADYNKDGITEYAVWRPNSGNWFVYPNFTPTQFGLNGDIPVPADYNNDGFAEYAVWRPGTGNWYVWPSFTPTQFGLNGDIPVPADYNGDGKAELAVWRPSTGNWYVYPSFTPTQFGLNGDIPVPADYNSDGKAELAVWRPSTGNWYVYPSFTPTQFGLNGDVPGTIMPSVRYRIFGK